MAMLFALGGQQQRSNPLILESDRLFVWCCGLFRQRIVISRALLDRLSSDQLELVLAHETAHAARFDNLRILSARWSTRLWPAKIRDRMLADLVADGEQSCDAVALGAVPDPSLFQQAVAAMVPGPEISGAESLLQVGSPQAAQRISAVSVGGDRRPSIAYLLVVCVCAIQVAVAIAASHPIVETISAVKLW
jgi:beta-lactamase regulating signal transducer with metallopeptidase domain